MKQPEMSWEIGRGNAELAGKRLWAMPSEWTTFSQHLSTILKAHDSLRVSLVGLVGLCHAKALCVSTLQPCSAQLFGSFLEILWHEKRRKQFSLPIPYCTGSCSPSLRTPWSPQTTAASCCRVQENKAQQWSKNEQFAFLTCSGISTVSYFFLIKFSQNGILQQLEQL